MCADARSQSAGIFIPGNEKDMRVVMTTVSVIGEKLPLYILTKGETVTVHSETRQLGDFGENMFNHTSTEWMVQ
jgi:hypothetical protein